MCENDLNFIVQTFKENGVFMLVVPTYQESKEYIYICSGLVFLYGPILKIFASGDRSMDLRGPRTFALTSIQSRLKDYIVTLIKRYFNAQFVNFSLTKIYSRPIYG